MSKDNDNVPDAVVVIYHPREADNTSYILMGTNHGVIKNRGTNSPIRSQSIFFDYRNPQIAV